MSHDVPTASNAMLAGPTAVRARSGDSNRSMCQKSGSLRPSGRTLLSMMLQPMSPRLSGEFCTHVDIGCAAAVFAVSTATSINAHVEHAACSVIWISSSLGERLNLRTTRIGARVLYSADGDGHTTASSEGTSHPPVARTNGGNHVDVAFLRGQLSSARHRSNYGDSRCRTDPPDGERPRAAPHSCSSARRPRVQHRVSPAVYSEPCGINCGARQRVVVYRPRF